MTASTPATTSTQADGVAVPLSGIRVIDPSTTAPGALATQFLADAGAEVIHVEAPGGSPLRTTAGWPALARGGPTGRDGERPRTTDLGQFRALFQLACDRRHT